MPKSGAFDLGASLFGGNALAEEEAYGKGRLARSQSEHLSAQTQEALAKARASQLEARKGQREQDAADGLADNLFTMGVVDTPEKAQALANIARAGFTDYGKSVEAGGKLQEQGFRRDLADTTLPQDKRLGAASGIQGKLQLHAEDEKPTTAIQNYNFATGLPDDKARGTFQEYAAPDKTIVAGGVPTSRRTGQALVDRATVAANAGAVEGAKAQARGQAKITLDQPAARARIAASDQKIDSIKKVATNLIADPDLKNAVGLKKPLGEIWGTGALGARANIRTLKSKIALAVLTDLRLTSKAGLGNVSNADIDLVKDGIAALDERMDADEFIGQLQEVVNYVDDIKARTHDAYDTQYPAQPGAAIPPLGAGGADRPVVKWVRGPDGKPVRAQ